jgi:26S proteasome regulatory subunit N8
MSLARAPDHKVVVHPLVLLSVVDHYNRVAKDTKFRVVGCLLGDASKDQVGRVCGCSAPQSVIYVYVHAAGECYVSFCCAV